MLKSGLRGDGRTAGTDEAKETPLRLSSAANRMIMLSLNPEEKPWKNARIKEKNARLRWLGQGRQQRAQMKSLQL